MKSMTGYGWGEAHSNHVHVEVTIRAVNGRYLEPRFHLPREYLSLESILKKTLGESVSRGTVDIFVTRKLKSSAIAKNVILNRELAGKYYEAYKSLSRDLKVKSEPRVDNLLRLPEVLKIEESTSLSAEEKQSVFKAFAKALQSFNVERKREGKGLREDLEGSLSELDAEVKLIAEIREKINGSLGEKFEQRIKARLSSIDFDASRLAQEIAIMTDKADINEELSRLQEHLKNYRSLVSSSSPIGKKLDFYTQELLREVNTIGAKSQVSQLTQHVVQAKTSIERLREQVQNVE